MVEKKLLIFHWKNSSIDTQKTERPLLRLHRIKVFNLVEKKSQSLWDNAALTTIEVDIFESEAMAKLRSGDY